MQFMDEFSENSPIGNNAMVHFMSHQFVCEFVSVVNGPLYWQGNIGPLEYGPADGS